MRPRRPAAGVTVGQQVHGLDGQRDAVLCLTVSLGTLVNLTGASLGYVFTQQTALLLRVTLITMAIGGVYWLAVILPQRGKAWHLLDAATATPAPEPVTTAETA